MWRAVDSLRRLPLAGFQQRLAEHAQGRAPSLVSAKFKLIDGCNLRCFMCDYWKGRRQGELGTAEVVAVLRDLASLGCQKVHFTGGEVFLRRDAIEILTECATLGMRINLTTNGTVLDKERARALLALPARSVTLSIDSPVRKIHDEVRGRAGALKKTLRTLDWLLAHRGPKTRIRINSVVSARTYASLIELPDLLAARPVDGLLLIPMDEKPATTDAGVGARLPVVRPTPHSMSVHDIHRYNLEVAPLLAERIRITDFDPYVFGRGPRDSEASAGGAYARGHYQEHACHVPWFHVLVNAEGDVYPCCMGHRTLPALGNVRHRSLRDIWFGDEYRQFRLEMQQQRKAICHNCDDFLKENRAIDAVVAERTTP